MEISRIEEKLNKKKKLKNGSNYIATFYLECKLLTMHTFVVAWIKYFDLNKKLSFAQMTLKYPNYHISDLTKPMIGLASFFFAYYDNVNKILQELFECYFWCIFARLKTALFWRIIFFINLYVNRLKMIMQNSFDIVVKLLHFLCCSRFHRLIWF